MFYSEHGVPHFHAVYGEHRISVEVESGVVRGSSPPRALSLVLGEVDLSEYLLGPVFELLRDVAYFRTFTVHPEFCTLVWSNGADFAPEFLHHKARVTA